jgi:hypothetical protein
LPEYVADEVVLVQPLHNNDNGTVALVVEAAVEWRKEVAVPTATISVRLMRPPEHDPVTLADHREIAWLAHDYAITILPSVSSLQALRPLAATAHAVAPFLGVGNPVLHPPTLASLYDGATLVLRPLPETASCARLPELWGREKPTYCSASGPARRCLGK